MHGSADMMEWLQDCSSVASRTRRQPLLQIQPLKTCSPPNVLSAPWCSHVFTFAVSLKRPRITSCTVQVHADCSVLLNKVVSTTRASLANGDVNGNTLAVMFPIFGHARSAPSARVRSCRSSTANAVKKRTHAVRVTSTAANSACTESVRLIHIKKNILHYQIRHRWVA